MTETRTIDHQFDGASFATNLSMTVAAMHGRADCSRRSWV